MKLAKRLQLGAHLSPEADVYRPVEGGEIVMPYGPALAEVAEDHFVFLTATSETGGETAELKLAAEVEDRFGRIEKAIGSLQDFIQTQFAAQAQPFPPRGISPGRDPHTEVPKPQEHRGGREKAPATRKGPRQSGGDYGSLDPSVVAEALKAGVPEGQLATLAGLLKKTSKMKDVPNKAPSRRRNVLSETEEEDEEQEEGRAEEEEGQAADPGASTMEQALLQLTKIAGSLAKSSKSVERKGMEQILEFHESSDSASSSSSRSKAAAYQRLRSALTEKPAMLVKALETAMDEDFAMLKTAPGSATREVSTRGWLESRSKLQYYPNTIRFGWILAGVHDAMRRDCHQEARARVLLAIAALDQTSLDSGALSELFRRAQVARTMGAAGHQTHRRPLGRNLDVEAERSGLFCRGQEKAASDSRSSSQRPCPGGSHSKAGTKAEVWKERRERWRKRCGSDRGADSPNLIAEEKGPLVEAVKAPGSGATTVVACRIWSEVFSALLRKRTKLSMSFRSALTRPSEVKAPKGQVWPCPLPFPEMHSRGCNKRQVDAPRKLAMNFVVLSLDLFHCGRRHFASAVPGLGTKLNLAQWQFIRSLTTLVDAWNAEADITPEVMGRAAAKVENVEQLLAGLCDEVGHLAGGLGNYAMPRPSRLQTQWGSKGSPGEVVGRLGHTLEHVAKAIQPERLKFWKTPSFDPSEFLDEANRETFLRPLDFACRPEQAEERPPPVRFRVSRKDKLRFVKLLDSSNRLALYPAGASRAGFECGGFGIPKDAHRDRLVLDARPANTLEKSERRWIKSLGSAAQLQHLFLSSSQVLKVFAEDLREYYHAFLISEQRKLRNILKMTVHPSDVVSLRAYKEKFADEPFLHVALATMAMGDLNAVAYGQCSHLGVLLQKGIITCKDLVCLKKVPPRQNWTCGLMIDDLVMLEAVDRTATPEDSVCFEKMEKVHRAYEEVGLPRHEDKSVSFAEEASFWGVQIDGVRGDARPNLSRAIPLCRLIVEVVRLGRASVGLLELLAGSLVSIFQLRRRFMSNLQEIYSAQRGRDRRDIVELSAELIDELLTCIPLVLLTKIDFRLGAAPFLVASDASSQLEAAVYAQLPPVAAEELHRHCLQKGLWAKLLRPEGAWKREKGILAEQRMKSSPAKTGSPCTHCGKRSYLPYSSSSWARYDDREAGGISTWAKSMQLWPPKLMLGR